MRRLCRLVLVLCALAGIASLCRADEPAAAPLPIHPEPMATDQPCADCSANFSHHSFFGWFNRHGSAGPAEPDSFCCGTVRSDCRFIFGTCQEFFGDPGLRVPPSLIHYPHSGQ
jgi:hypothetical protein